MISKINAPRARASKLLDDIMKQIAVEEGLTFKKVDGLLHTVFAQIAADIRSGTLKGSHIRYLGKFLVKPYNVHKFYENQDKKDKLNGSNT